MESSLFFMQFAKLFPELNLALGAGIMIFSRLIGIMQFAPPFNRSEMPAMVRISFALIITVILCIILKPTPIPDNSSLLLGIILNFS